MSNARDIADLSFDNGTLHVDRVNNRVGVGTETPSSTLHVSGGALVTGGIELRSDLALTKSGASDANPNWVYFDNAIAFARSGVGERLRVSSSGNVGIGVSSPVAKLDLATAVGRIFLTSNGSNNAISSVNAANNDYVNMDWLAGVQRWFTAGTERMCITSTGNVGIGTSSPATKLDIWGNVRASPGAFISSVPSSSSTDNSQAFVMEENGATGEARRYAVSLLNGSGPTAREAYWRGILCNVAYDTQSYQRWLTGGTERMVLDGNGNLGIGTNALAARVRIRKDNSNSYENAHIELISSGGGNVVLGFHVSGYFASCIRAESSGGGNIDIVNSNLSGFAPIRAAAFNVNSDYRVKENIVPLEGAIDRLMQLKPRRFNFVEGSMMWNDGRTVDGFVAHEVSPVVPEAVSGEKDGVNKDGDKILQSLDQSKLIPLLTAAIQEQQELIVALQASNAALEARIAALEAV